MSRSHLFFASFLISVSLCFSFAVQGQADNLGDFGIRPAQPGEHQGDQPQGGAGQDLVVIGDPHGKGGQGLTGGDNQGGTGQETGGSGSSGSSATMAGTDPVQSGLDGFGIAPAPAGAQQGTQLQGKSGQDLVVIGDPHGQGGQGLTGGTTESADSGSQGTAGTGGGPGTTPPADGGFIGHPGLPAPESGYYPDIPFGGNQSMDGTPQFPAEFDNTHDSELGDLWRKFRDGKIGREEYIERANKIMNPDESGDDERVGSAGHVGGFGDGVGVASAGGAGMGRDITALGGVGVGEAGDNKPCHK